MNKSQDKFMQGIFALMLSQVVIKVLGLVYSVYLTNKRGFGDEGNAIYMSGYQIYALLLAISSIGIPNAISKLVSEKIAIRDYKGADRIFKIAITLFSIIGFSCTSILFFGAEKIARDFIQIPESVNTLKALSPAIFFVSVSAVIRGYCNGKNSIQVTANSQTLEQASKTIFTIFLVELVSVLSCYNTKLMATVANLATTIATIISFIYIFSKTKQIRKKELFNINRKYFEKERIKTIIKKIFSVSIPMSISSLLSTINKNIDSITVVRILKKVLGENKARMKYGILSTKVDLLITMPMAFNIAFSTALVPEIASSLIKNDFENINKRLKFSILTTILIGLPCTVGIFFYSRQILNLLFPNANSGAECLKFSSIIIIFGVLTQTINGALQGLGKNKIPAIALFYGVIIKFICNILFIPIEGICEKGAVIGNILCHVVTFCIVYNVLTETIELNFKLHKIIKKPIIITIIMISISFGVYNELIYLGFYEYISTIIGIIIAVIVYILLIFIFKVFSKDEIFMLPKGEKIYNFLKKIKIYS